MIAIARKEFNEVHNRLVSQSCNALPSIRELVRDRVLCETMIEYSGLYLAYSTKPGKLDIVAAKKAAEFLNICPR